MYPALLPTILPSSDSIMLIKLALTNDQCGALIGKGGGVITTLQRSCGVLIKAGSVDELFPGTPFRPAIIRGTIDGIHACLTELVKILHRDHILRTETEASSASSISPPLPPSNTNNGVIRHQDFAVRLLIPDSAAGAIIGKQGTVIRALCDNSGASIRLSAPDHHRDNTVFERVVAVTGTGPSVVSAVVSIFLTLASDSRHLMYANPTVVYPRILETYNEQYHQQLLLNTANSSSNPTNTNNSFLANFPNNSPLFTSTNDNNNRLINSNASLLTSNINYEPTLTNGYSNSTTILPGNNSMNHNHNTLSSQLLNINTHQLTDNNNNNNNPWIGRNISPLTNPNTINNDVNIYTPLSTSSTTSSLNKNFSASDNTLSSFGNEKNVLSVSTLSDSPVANENEAAMLAARHALANHRNGFPSNITMISQPPLPTNAPPPLPTGNYTYPNTNNNSLPTNSEYHPAYASILMSTPIDNLLRGHRTNNTVVSNPSSSNTTIPASLLPNNYNPNRNINIPNSPNNNNLPPSPPRNFVSGTLSLVSLPIPSNGYNSIDFRNGKNEQFRNFSNNNQLSNTNESSSSLNANGITTNGRLLPPVAEFGTINSLVSTNNNNTNNNSNYNNQFSNESFQNNLITEDLRNQLSSLNL